MRLFKTVRADGGSWHNPDFRYEVGKRYRATGPDREMCADGLLHASETAAEAGTWAHGWPFRLLQVDGVPVEKDTRKVGCRQLVVVAESDVAECFGPNGAAVVALLDLISTATTDQVNALGATRYAMDVAMDAAWYAVWDVAMDAAWYAVWDAATDAARDAARYAARDAARALVVADLVGQHGYTQNHHDLLLKPVRTVFGTEWETSR